MQCVAAGMSNQRIAAFYGLAHIKKDMRHILKVTGCVNRENLVWWWCKNVV